MKAHDLRGILSTLKEMDFHELAPFNGGTAGVSWASGGTSPWERLPDDEDFLMTLDGRADITVPTPDGPVVGPVNAGCAFVVPCGLWHRHTLHGTVKELHVSPGRSALSADDPRR